MNHSYSIYRLHQKIDELSKLVDLKKIIEGEKNSNDEIRSYYRINHWAITKNGFSGNLFK